jgi:hypothetical protein
MNWFLLNSYCVVGLLVIPPANALTLTTWNLQHMMSESTFDDWAAFCVKHGWDEEKVKAAVPAKPKKLMYCNAHNGILCPTSVKELKPLQTRGGSSYRHLFHNAFALQATKCCVNFQMHKISANSNCNADSDCKSDVSVNHVTTNSSNRGAETETHSVFLQDMFFSRFVALFCD